MALSISALVTPAGSTDRSNCRKLSLEEETQIDPLFPKLDDGEGDEEAIIKKCGNEK